MRRVPCPTACAKCARPGHYRLEGQCRTCPATDGTAMIIIMSLVVVCAAPILFKVSEQAGAYTRPLLSSTRAESVTRKHPTHPKHTLNTPLTRATKPLRAPPIPYKALKLR